MTAALPTLDAHCHLDPGRSQGELDPCGAVLAMTFRLDEAARTAERRDVGVAWGAGCHPRSRAGQKDFDETTFRAILGRTAVVGEVGLDARSPVPPDVQLRNLRLILGAVTETPRIVSIHSVHATRSVLDELRRRPIAAPILHGWTGDASETVEAVHLGCYFSISAAIARHSKFRRFVPLEHVLVETDHGYSDPPAAIPCRVEWAEHLVAQQYRLDVIAVRTAVWRNLERLVRLTGTSGLLPSATAAVLAGLDPG